ncbi:MAG: acyl-CoA synthetase, partial [Desulfobacteraceae bacterium]|nr:acyl-CoA synthetase [Desulfobacteraceae bacterium]
PSFPSEMEAALIQSEATILISVPAHYRALGGHPIQAPALRLAFSSAGMLAEEDGTAFSTQTGVPVVEVYGSTETGGIAERVRARGEFDFKPFPPIDISIEGDRLALRSDYLSPELQLRTDGYFMIADRVRAAAGDRFALLGRLDGIVKVGGQRVDLEAVRQSLKNQPGVRDAAVLSLPVAGGRQNQIVALVASDADDFQLEASALQTLAPYARPRSIKVVAQIPMTAAGKIDRKTIAAMFEGKSI